ncbi:MAG: galactosyltransferase, partial [Rhodospirillales bacterium]|nr:galactosyltransferase [Rhodospirillales bacterium]
MFETGKRLTIIVPYRDRESQLRNWLPYLRLYFARDKIDRHIEVRFLVVEQANDLPFNRGRLLNIGFVLAEESSDYVCFHDVDYMPLWADYSYSAQPTRIIWYGADIKPIDPASNVRVQEHEESFFGAVVLFPNERFRQVNGFSNT